MTHRTVVFFVVAAGAAGCGLGAEQTAHRTVAGLSERQLATAAHRLLVEQGFEFRGFDPDSGAVATEWHDAARRSLRYEVAATPGGEGQDAGAQTCTLVVKALARDRAVGGWSAEYPAPGPAGDLLDEIVGLAPSVEPPPEDEETGPVRGDRCARSTDCPPGMHCGSGRCVAECAMATECMTGEECDPRGRCVHVPPPPPPPPPCPEPEAPRRGR